MKRYLLYCFFVCVLLLAACASTTTESMPPAIEPDTGALPETAPPLTTDFSKPTFYLAALPDLAPFEAPREIINRYSQEVFVDTLKPAADYGRLYPYEGIFVGAHLWMQKVYFGLVDAQGRVVVDPVYSQAYYHTLPGIEPAYLMLVYPADKNDAEAQKLMQDSQGFINRGRYVFASADGAWVSDIYYGDDAMISEDRIIVYDYSAEADDYWSDQSSRIYDLQGNFIARIEGRISAFQEGLGAVSHNEYDAKIGRNQNYYDYIDKYGRVVIAGPFWYAENFVNGRANVEIGEDWEYIQRGVIDTRGNYIVEPVANENMDYGLMGDYIRYNEDGKYGETLFGIKKLDGSVLIPAQYTWIDYNEQGDTLMIGQRGDGDYWFIDLDAGEERKIELGGDMSVIYANICADNWCMVRYEKNGSYSSGIALIKGDAEYYFDAPDCDVYCSYIQENLFALNFSKNEQDRPVYYTEIFDSAQEKIIERVDGYRFDYSVNDTMLVFYNPINRRLMVLNHDLKPVFNANDFGGDSMQMIRHVADDVYSIRTTFYSGLIKENGQWLIRVYANNMD